MLDRIEKLLTMYERHELNRRQLLRAMSIAVLPSGQARSSESLFSGRLINHVTLGVVDPGRSRAFYQGVFGAAVQHEQANALEFRIGNSFVAANKSGQPVAIQHYCVGVDDFDGDSGLKRLQDKFADSQPRLVTNEFGQKQLILKDPNGITVEIADVRYRL
jgi:catechol 2,3-dioxygenase-like lactoylglutathione lyase family enzyme